MKKQMLNGTWQMMNQKGEQYSGVVPGSVYSFLLENDAMEDPFYRDNELDALRLLEEDYIFTKHFVLNDEIKDSKTIFLHCDGLDTLCNIYINDNFVGKADNFHRIWEYEVTPHLKDGENIIKIVIDSPINFIKEKDKEYHVGGSTHAMEGFPHLRKPHCMFGWDWGPRLPDAGIWRDIYLFSADNSRLVDVKVKQEHNEGQVGIIVKADQTGHALVKITLTTPTNKVLELKNNEYFQVPNPELWWPNGLGEQPLYNIQIELYEQEEIVDSREMRIGLRTMSISRRKDKWGESFAHIVNGVEFFAMGANYIPEDNIFSRITIEKTKRLLQQCKMANFNVIRIWGGGAYPSNEFYDICDELGLVVWQDFMFACANYKLDFDFEDNITAEIKDNVKRLRHHASLGLWCGNNEMEMFAARKHYDGSDITKAHYIRMYEHIIPHILREVDPDTFYWPASPSSGGSFDSPNDPDRGDVHYWEVWHGNAPFSEYRKNYFRYVSEFGFQSFPSLKTIKSFAKEEDLNIFSRVMEMHQRNEGANGKIMNYLSKTYLYPGNFDTLVYASQLLQAEAIKYGVEHWRRNRGRCMGAIYWQLNDIWPVASWSSIDYFGRWKALHYYAKRFFSPIMISCEEVCETTTRTSVVAEPGEIINTARLNVTNESQEAVSGIVRWSLRDSTSKIIYAGEEELKVDALSSVWMPKQDFNDTDYLNNHFTYEFVVEDDVVSKGSVLFTAPKHYQFKDPSLSYEIKGDQIFIHAKAYAKNIEISSPDCDLVLSDNYFDMEAGSIKINIIEGDPVRLKLRSVYDIK